MTLTTVNVCMTVAALRFASQRDAAPGSAVLCIASRLTAAHLMASRRSAVPRNATQRLDGAQMPNPKIVTFTITGASAYSQSKPHLTPMEPNESHEDFRNRTWHHHLHLQDGKVIIPPGAIKNCLSEAAKFMNISIPGKGKATFTKHIEAGLAVMAPIQLGIKFEDVQKETLFLPADGRRGSGKRVWKTYPYVFPWQGVVEVVVIDETCLQTSARDKSKVVLQEIIEGAGQYIGIGRFRPRQNGYYGRFAVSDFEIGEIGIGSRAA